MKRLFVMIAEETSSKSSFASRATTQSILERLAVVLLIIWPTRISGIKLEDSVSWGSRQIALEGCSLHPFNTTDSAFKKPETFQKRRIRIGRLQARKRTYWWYVSMLCFWLRRWVSGSNSHSQQASDGNNFQPMDSFSLLWQQCPYRSVVITTLDIRLKQRRCCW